MSRPRISTLPVVLTRALLVAGCALPLLAAPALAQDGEQEFTPSNEELDRELDESLAEEYSAEEAPPKQEKIPDYAAEHDEEAKDDDDGHDRLRLRFGGLAAYAWTGLGNIELSHREGGSGGGVIELAHEDNDDFQFDNGAGMYRAWIGIGRYVSLQGGWFHGRFGDTNALSNAADGTPGFTFGSSRFNSGDIVEINQELRVADFDVVVHPLTLKWIRLDFSLGARYAYWETRIERLNRGYNKEEDRIEGLIPMVGFGLTLSPVEPLAFFLRGKVGTIEYEREGGYYRRTNGNRRYVEPKERSHTSAELDAGMTFTIANTFGFIVGARIQYIELERVVPDRSSRVEGYATSLYAGVLLNF